MILVGYTSNNSSQGGPVIFRFLLLGRLMRVAVKCIQGVVVLFCWIFVFFVLLFEWSRFKM